MRHLASAMQCLIASTLLLLSACGGSGVPQRPSKCTSVSDCEAATPCRDARCEQGTCVYEPLAEGTILAEQVARDCKVRLCDGAGDVVEEFFSGDFEDDGNPCTIDECSPQYGSVHTALPPGTQCLGPGNARVCNDQVACVECIESADCGDGTCVDEVCVPVGCGDGVREGAEACDGEELGGETCDTLGEDFDGGTLACRVNCQFDTSGCNPALPLECSSDSDCEAAATPCRGARCEERTCIYEPIPGGSIVEEQVRGDCKVRLCDGDGGVMEVPSMEDPEDDRNPCTSDFCDGSVPDHPALPARSACQGPGNARMCDGQGVCVECLESADCGAGRCVDQACVPASCGNGILDGAEACDGEELGGETCDTLEEGFDGGTLTCGENCQFDTSGCNLAPPSPCASGQPRVYAVTGLPMPVPDLSAVTLPVSVAETGYVMSATVLFSANHARDADLDVSLLSPGGTQIDLTSDNGGDGQGYVDTVFDDRAAISILDGAAPFTGAFRPESMLAVLHNTSASGLWKFKVEDDTTGSVGAVTALELRLCVSPARDACGNGVVDIGEVCDGTNLGGETCTTVSGGFVGGILGCAPDCRFDTRACRKPPACPAGQTGKLYTAAGLPKPIPDNSASGLLAPVTVADPGYVMSARVRVNIAHNYVMDLDIFLVPPGAAPIELSTDNGGEGDNYTDTLFTDEAARRIVDGSPPFTGAFVPETPLSQAINLPAAGTWTLKVADDAAMVSGTLQSFELELCLTPQRSPCGNGVIDAGEECDGGNLAGLTCDTVPGGFGGGALRCTNLCRLDTSRCLAAPTCPAGQVGRAFAATGLPIAIPDNSLSGVQVALPVSGAGVVQSIAVLFGAEHTYDADLDVRLIAPTGATIELSTDNGLSGDNYVKTLFTDAAPSSITSGSAPFTGSFKPESPLSALAGTQLAGLWYLQVADDTSSATGSVTEFQLQVCVTGFAQTCGNGALDAGEVCDGAQLGGANCLSVPSGGFMGGTLSCDSQCRHDVGGCLRALVCPAGESLITVDAAGLPMNIPDNQASGVTAPLPVTSSGFVRSAAAKLGIAHEHDSDLDVSLYSPGAIQVALTSGNGGKGVDYVDTIFSDQATQSIVLGEAPFTGAYRPEMPLGSLHNSPAVGTWMLKVADVSSFSSGQLTSFQLQLCVAPSKSSCGNGTLDPGEDCEGANLAGRSCATFPGGFVDGTLRCQADCRFDTSACLVGMACPAGQTSRAFAATGVPVAMPDGNAAGVLVPISISDTGFVQTASVVFSARHNWVMDIDLYLISPAQQTVELSTDNGDYASGLGHVATVFSDSASVSITAGAPPFRGSYRPEQALSLLGNTPMQGTWQLKAVDDSVGSSGTVEQFELRFCVSPGVLP